MTSEKEALLLTVPELARQLQIGKNTAYELCHRRDFPAVKIGRAVRINKAGLQGWLNENNGGILL